MKKYNGYIPPCGIYCGSCPRYKNGTKNSCDGAEVHCVKRKCKTIYICCVEKRGLTYCNECNIFPCAKFKKFRDTWLKYGQDLFENQKMIKEHGEAHLFKLYYNKTSD